ncbi:MAG TPA: hypothetical protein VK440_03350 [Burkholderiales bacterium]|nr:hypothetical protein [Burkholderiales bacterium]
MKLEQVNQLSALFSACLLWLIPTERAAASYQVLAFSLAILASLTLAFVVEVFILRECVAVALFCDTCYLLYT